MVQCQYSIESSVHPKIHKTLIAITISSYPVTKSNKLFKLPQPVSPSLAVTIKACSADTTDKIGAAHKPSTQNTQIFPETRIILNVHFIKRHNRINDDLITASVCLASQIG